MEDGSERDTHIRISAGLRNKEKEVVNGHFSIRIEVDTFLISKILDPPMNGYVSVGACSSIEVRGGGIEQARRERMGLIGRMERMEVVNEEKDE